MNKNLKRILAGVLSTTLLLSSAEFSSIVNNKFIAATKNDKSLENFMDEVSSLYEENDLSNMIPDITFSKESENTVVIDDTIMVPVEVLTDNTDISYSDIKEDIVEQDNEKLVAVEDVAKNTDYEAIKNDDESITLSKIYQSKTLIVKSPVQIDTYNAENVISGYGNLYILKYATEEDTKDAYDKFLQNKNIDSVEIDSLICAETLETFIEETRETVSEESSEDITETDEITESSEDTAINEEETLSEIESSEELSSESITESSEESPSESIAESSEKLSSESTEETTTEQETETITIPDGVIVAILDSGIDTNNALFDGRIVDLGLNLSTSGEGIQDDNGHGTAVASVIAKNSDAYLMPIKITNSDGKGTVLSLYLAIQAAIENEADIINLSLTASSSDLLTSIIEEAEQKGIIVVAAAGNQNANVENYAPANIESVITVAATDEEYRPASYSNYGNLIDYSALGTLLNEENNLQGTSISAAYVTGVIAKILCENENANVTEELSKYVYDFGEEGKDDYYGNGVVSLEEITAPEETEDDEILIPEDTPEEGINLEAATTINGVVYTYASNTLTLTGSGTVTNEWQSYNTTWAGYVAGVKTININSDTLTGIDANAFEGCTNLTTVTFTKYNNGVINTNAFADVTTLRTLTIGNAITNINASAFSGCTSLNTLTIGTGLTTIGENAFLNAPLATKITFNAVDLTTHNNVFQNKETASLAIGSGVTQLPDSIFKGLSKITAVTIPAKSTTIGASAFEECSSLTKVTFATGSTCTEIGESAFKNCSKLSNVVNYTTNYTLPATVAVIGNNAFENCASMTTIVTGNGVTTIGTSAFSGCASLNTLTIGTKVETIGENAFLNVPLATKIALNAANLENHNNVFNGKETAAITIANATQLPDGLFKDCTKLTAITIPATVTSIGSSVFEGCTALAKVTFASGSKCTEIGNAAFKNCTSLNSIVDNATANRLPNVIKMLGDSAFENTALTTLQSGTTATTGVTAIGNDVFKGCDSLINLTLYNQDCVIGNKDAIPDTTMIYGLADSPVKAYATENDKLFVTIGTAYVSGTDGNITWKLTLSNGALAISGTGDMNDYTIGSAPWYKYRKLIKTVTIANTVTSVGSSAFEDCTALTKVTFASGSKCTKIGDDAFKNCTVLSNVVNNTTNYTLPATVTVIGNNAFEKCTSMTTFVTGNGVITIETSAFSGCTSLNTLTIGTGVTTIGTDAFKDAPLATSITFNAVNLTTHNNVFQNKETASLAIGAGVTKLPDGIFKGLSKITAVTIPAKCTIIGASAFEECSSLAKVTFATGSTCTEIGESAFKNCSKLSNVVNYTTNYTLPATVTVIGNNAFENCKAMPSIIIGNNVTSIGVAAFKNCITLNTLVIGTGVTAIGEDAFLNAPLATKITFNATNCETYNDAFVGRETSSITIGSTVTNLPDNVFKGLSKITAVTIPAKCTTVGTSAFEGCSSLTKVVFAANSECTKIGDNAFKNCSKMSNVVNNTTNYTLPTSVEMIGKDAFQGCIALTKLKIKNADCTIGDSKNTISGATIIYGYINSFAEEYALKYNKHFISFSEKDAWSYGYNAGNYHQIFVVPYTGLYKLDVWGAQGESATLVEGSVVETGVGGKGSFASGYVNLKKGDVLYLYVGGQGSGGKGGWNGGGNGGGAITHSGSVNGVTGTITGYRGGGGGATDIRLNNVYANNRILVAGGGGGAGVSLYGGSVYDGKYRATAGGHPLNGYSGPVSNGILEQGSSGATNVEFSQTSSNYHHIRRVFTGGGGGGYYGGATSAPANSQDGFSYAGTSYGIPSIVSNFTYTPGVQAGNGKASITLISMPYEEEIIEEYTVIYDGNGATGGSTESQTFQAGDSVKIRENGFTKEGYEFTGWNTEADGSGTSYSIDVEYSDTADLTLYAQWSMATIDIPVTITWVDSNNEYASRPSKVALRLMNGTEVVKEAQKVIGDNASPASTNVWTYKFQDVDMYDSNGKEIQYTVVEGAYNKKNGTFVADFVTSLYSQVAYKTPVYEGDSSGLTIVNELIPSESDEEDPTKDYGVTISGTVTWKDENDKYHFRPDSVIVELYQDGKLYDSIELKESTADYKFTGLPMMDSSFKKYTYTIKEKDIDNYEITYKSDDKTTTVEDDFGNTVTTTAYMVDIINTFTPDKKTERFSDNQLTMQATFLNENGNAATESDFKKVQLDKEDVNTTIVLKQLNLSWEPVNAEEGKYIEIYSGYSGNEINLILHGTDRTYVNDMPYGKYEILVENDTNFSLDSIEELDSKNVQFTYENGKYYITYSYEYEEAKEDLNVNMTLKSYRGYTSKVGIKNFFKNSN